MYENMMLRYFTSDESFPFYINYGEHTEEMRMHGHEDFYELVVVLEGSAVHVTENGKYRISKGDVFVIGKDLCHGYEEPDGLKICNIMFRPDTFITADHDIKQLPGFHALFLLEPRFSQDNALGSRMKLPPDAFAEVSNIIAEAVREYEGHAPGSRTLITACFLRIAVILSRLYGAENKRREIEGISLAAAYMESHSSEEIPMERLAEMSHYSQRHFIRLFSEIYEVAPHRYLTDIRIRRAASLLRDTRLDVSEISIRCGFSDPNYFSRIFRKYYGTSPLKYRNNEFMGELAGKQAFPVNE